MAEKEEYITSVDNSGTSEVLVEETHADVKPFNRKPENARIEGEVDPGARPAHLVPKVGHRPQDLYYDMSQEKQLVIFNQRKFKATKFYKNKAPTPRVGTDEDVKSIKSVFGGLLGFNVKVHNDLAYEEIWNTFIEMYNTDYSALSCMCIVILTHGDANGELYASDRSYELKQVIKLFEKNTTLANKPKLFFVQACRGSETDAGVTVSFDGDQSNETFVTPSQADFLVMRSTVEDYTSYRDIRGSWMIQELCDALKNHYKEWDLLHIITLAQRCVATDYRTYTPKNISIDNKKQIPETCFTLTKLVKFY